MDDITPVIVTATPVPIQTIVPSPTLLVQYGNETFMYILPPNGILMVCALVFFFACGVLVGWLVSKHG